MFTKADIERYFVGEKQESLWFMIIGIAAIVAAIVFFFFLKNNFYKGVAIPLFVVGIILGIVGYSVYRSCDEYRKRNVYSYDMDPSQLKNKELPRMEKVMKNFVVLRYTELFLLLGGIALYIYFMRDIRNDLWRGLGLALAVMAIIALAMDFFAERRGKTYVNGLKSFTSKIN